MYFEWDQSKARKNLAKHRVDFAEAASIFGDSLSITISDPMHSIDEERFVTMGTSAEGRLLVVVHTDRIDTIRIISARKATKRERTVYEGES